MLTDIFIIVRIVPETAPPPSDLPILISYRIEAFDNYTDPQNCLSYQENSIVAAGGDETRLKIPAQGCSKFEGREAHDHSLHIEKVSLKMEWIEPKDSMSDDWVMVEMPKPNKTRSRFSLIKG
jgi:hypothetical protein